MSGSAESHWRAVYSAKASDEHSWFQRTPAIALRLLTEAVGPTGSVIDVGAGTSTLVDALVAAGWRDVTALDISAEALAQTRARLPSLQAAVFVVSDVLDWAPTRTYDAWHDRAVFHFLVDDIDRRRYVAGAERAIAPGGALVLGTFAADGPTSCSGLPTARYQASDLADVFADSFTLERAEREEHRTPWGATQPFTWAVLRRA